MIRRLFALLSSLPLELRAVLFVAAVVRCAGIGWGMPASDSWDVDGIAPRDFLPGLAQTFTPGDHATYPPLHFALLAIVTLPITLIAVVKAENTSIQAVLREIIAPPYMTAMTMSARLIALFMSLGILIAIAKIGEEITGRRRAGTFAAAFAACGIPFAYYGRTSNLDVPSLFWASLAVLVLVRAVARNEPRRLRRFALLAACAIATKDQTYALFVLAVPLVLVAWAAKAVDRKLLAREAAIGAAMGGSVLLVIDGALFNPSGFLARIEYLRGSASQDYAMYEKGWDGTRAILVDTLAALGLHVPLAVFAGALIVLGVAQAVRSEKPVVALIPAAIVLSFTVGFNFAARRVEERFTLPQFLFASLYAGVAMEWLSSKSSLRLAMTVCAPFFVLSLAKLIELDLNLMRDPRYAVEDYLAANVKPGDVVEVHGLNVYLPRIPRGVRAVRVGPSDPTRRGPIPGLEELQAPLMQLEARAPRFVVANECYFWRYTSGNWPPSGGHVKPEAQRRLAADPDGTELYARLFSGQLGYKMVLDSRFKHPWWSRIHLHASVGCPTFVFERAR